MKMVFDRETKNTVRYSATVEEVVSGRAVCEVIYLQKNLLPKPYPKRINIIIEKEE